MGIELNSKTWKARIICDQCRKPINGLDEGNLIHSVPERGKPVTIAFVHKVGCDPRSNREQYRCFLPLELFLSQLRKSLKKKRPTIKRVYLP
jgi:hypothetical protein